MDRRSRILALLADQPLTAEALRHRLQPVPSVRQLADDLAVLRAWFPGRLVAERQARANLWRFCGTAPRLLAAPLRMLDDDQIAALIAARGLLRLPDPDRPAIDDGRPAWNGALSKALDPLLTEAGLGEEARTISPEAISISRFGCAPEECAL